MYQYLRQINKGLLSGLDGLVMAPAAGVVVWVAVVVVVRRVILILLTFTLPDRVVHRSSREDGENGENASDDEQDGDSISNY